MRMTDQLEALERALAKYPPGQEGAVLNRRLVWREVLEPMRAEAFQEGYTEGMKDAFTSARADAELADGKDDDNEH